MPEIDPVILQLRADVDKYRLDVQDVTRRVNENLDSQGKSVVRLERQIEASTGRIGSSLKAMAGALAAGFSAREVASMADSYTRFTNQLKVAGLEGENLAGTQQRLFQVAQQNGVEIEAVGTLYSRAAQNQKELGASTQDLIGLTRAVAASLRISGTSTNEASGALLQLGQALGSPRVQAEEFNSLIDTMQPLLREAAKYIDGTGGSLAGLTRLIKDQNGAGVSNIQLFQAINRAMADLEKTAGQTTLTISGAFTNLTNAITKFVGEADQANGATVVVTQALNALADNLDTVTEALSILAAIMVSRYAAGMIAGAGATAGASAAIFALQARAAGAATTMEALAFTGTAAGRTLLAAFGGPVGLALAALTLGVAYLATRTDEASVASGEYAKQQKALTDIQGRAAKAADAVATATGRARNEALANAKALQQETQQYIANAKAAVTAARAKASQAAQDARAVANSAGAQSVGVGSAMIVGGNIVGQRVDREARQAQTNLRVAQANLSKAEAEEKRLNAVINGLTPPPVSNIAPTGTSAKSRPATGGGASGPSASEIADRQAEELSRLNQEELRARIALTTNIDDRAELQRELLAAERDERVQAINADRDLDAKQKAARIAYIEELYGKPTSDVDGNGIRVEANKSLYAQQLTRDIREEETRLANDALSRQIDALDAQAGITLGLSARRDLERRALELQQQIERNLLEQDIATGRVADAQAARADLMTAQAARGTALGRQYESPLDQRRREVRTTAANMNDAVENIELDAIDRLTTGLADASTEFVKLGGVAGDVLNGIIRDMIRLAAQQAIFGSAGSGGILGSIGGLLGLGGRLSGVNYGALNTAANTVRIPGFAKGTKYAPGGLALVGEEGPEIVELPRGSRVIPNHNIAAAASMVSATALAPAAGQTNGTIRVALTMDNDVFTARVQEASVPVAVEVVRQSGPSMVAAAKSETLRDLSRSRM